MPKLTADQIRGYASAAGFSGNDLNIAVAVALAESGGNTQAHNSTPPDDSYGLWQINMLGSMGPDRRKRFGLSKNEDLYDPATNARAAYGIFKSQGWSNGWTTYKSGKYKEFMSDTGTGTGSPGTEDQPVQANTDGGIVTGGLNALGANIFNAVQNVGGIVIGVVLIAGAIVLLAMQSKTGKKVVNVAAKKVL